MDLKDVNRINYKNYCVGKNLDFLVRSKMRSESLSTPLKNTPPFYDDRVSSKMSLLGKRGYYDPGYIYGFSNEEQPNEENIREGEYPKEQIPNQNIDPYEENIPPPRNIGPEPNYKEEQEFKNIPNRDNYISNNNYHNYNNMNMNNYNDEMLYRERMNERQTPQKLDNFQLDRTDPNEELRQYEQDNLYNNNIDMDKFKPKNYENVNKFKINNDDYKDLYYEQIVKNVNNNGMIRNEDKIQNQDYYKKISEYDYILNMARQNKDISNLPLTKNQILQNIYSNKRQKYE